MPETYWPDIYARLDLDAVAEQAGQTEAQLLSRARELVESLAGYPYTLLTLLSLTLLQGETGKAHVSEREMLRMMGLIALNPLYTCGPGWPCSLGEMREAYLSTHEKAMTAAFPDLAILLTTLREQEGAEDAQSR